MLAFMRRVSVAIGVVAAWTTALFASTVGAGLVLLAGAKGASNYLDDFCVEGGRGPRRETAYGSPHPAGLGQWRCDYGGHRSATYTAWFPFLGGVVGLVVVLLVFVAPLVVADFATRRQPGRLAKAA